MTITIDWNTSIISVPKVDTILIQSVPTEIRELNINTFRLVLRNLEDDEAGMSFLPTHNHFAPLDVGGVTLARVVELINNFTVTFEDGQYAINIIGGNSNIGDNINVNQVSIRSFNSAGLVTSAGIEAIEYQNSVTIDVTTTSSGTLYPTGTPRRPVNNIDDAKLIAQTRGFTELRILGDITFLATDNIDNFTIRGQHPAQTKITCISGVSTNRTIFTTSTITGDVAGAIFVIGCNLEDLDNFGSTVYDTTFHDCIFEQAVYSINTNTTQPIYFIDSVSGIAGHGGIQFDMNGSVMDFLIRGWEGGIEIINLTNINQNVAIEISQGHITVSSSCVTGNIVAHGLGMITDNSGVGCNFDVSGIVNPVLLTLMQKYMWNKMHVDTTTRAPQVWLQIYDDVGTTVVYEHRLLTITGEDPVVDSTGISDRGDQIII